jgi:hypothetical protein
VPTSAQTRATNGQTPARALPAGSPAGVVRRPILKESVTVASPLDGDIRFVIKRMGNRERIRRQNMFQSMRYITEEVTGRSVVERDVPMGEIAVQDILMGLVGWNLTDDRGRELPITEDTIQDYLEAEEFDFVLEQIRETNPIVFGGTGTGASAQSGGPKAETPPETDEPELTEVQEAVTTPT